MAVVFCDLPSGLHLDVGDLNGPKTRLTLAHGVNVLDDAQSALWARWASDHAQSSLVADRRVYEEVAPEPQPEPEAPAADDKAAKAAAVRAKVEAAKAAKDAQAAADAQAAETKPNEEPT